MNHPPTKEQIAQKKGFITTYVGVVMKYIIAIKKLILYVMSVKRKSRIEKLERIDELEELKNRKCFNCVHSLEFNKSYKRCDDLEINVTEDFCCKYWEAKNE